MAKKSKGHESNSGGEGAPSEAQEMRKGLLEQIKELGERLRAIKHDEASAKELRKLLAAMTKEARRLSLDDSEFAEKVGALNTRIDDFKSELASLEKAYEQAMIDAEEARARGAEVAAGEPIEKGARKEHQVVANAKFGHLTEAMKLADAKLPQDQKNLVRFEIPLEKLTTITKNLAKAENDADFAAHLADFNTKFEELLGSIDPEVRKVYEARTKGLPRPEPFIAQAQPVESAPAELSSAVEPSAPVSEPTLAAAEAAPVSGTTEAENTPGTNEVTNVKKRLEELGKQLDARIDKATKQGVLDQFIGKFDRRAQELVDRIKKAKGDEITPLIIQYEGLIKEMSGAIDAFVKEKNKGVVPEAAAHEKPAGPESVPSIQAEQQAEHERCRGILSEKIKQFNDLSEFAQENGVDEKFDQFVEEGNLFVEEMERNAGPEFDKLVTRFDKWMKDIKKDVDLSIKAKLEAEAAATPAIEAAPVPAPHSEEALAATAPEPAGPEPSPVATTAPEKKGIWGRMVGWTKEKLGGAKEYAKFAVSKEGRKPIAEMGYRSITKIFGVKLFTDLLIAVRGKGDLYEYVKGRKGTKAEKKAVSGILKEMISITEEGKRKERAAESPGKVLEAEAETQRALEQKALELRQKIDEAKYIPDSEKKELQDKLLEIITARDEQVEKAKLTRDKKIQDTLSAYIVNKVSGYRIASDALDVLLVSLPTLRPLVYGGMAAAERAQKAGRKIAKEGKTETRMGKEASILHDITVNAAKETYRGLTFKGIEGKADATKKEKFLGFVKAFGTVARGLGIVGLGLGAGKTTQQSIENLLGAFEKGAGTGAIQLAKGFSDNLERMMHPLDTAHNAARRIKGVLGLDHTPSPTGEVLTYKLKHPPVDRIPQAGAAAAAAEAMPVPETESLPELIPGVKTKLLGDINADGVLVTAKGPSSAVHELKNFFKAHDVKWGHKEVVAAMQEKGYVFHADGSVTHPAMFHKNGGKLVPWIDANNKGHFEIVSLRDKGVVEMNYTEGAKTHIPTQKSLEAQRIASEADQEIYGKIHGTKQSDELLTDRKIYDLYKDNPEGLAKRLQKISSLRTRLEDLVWQGEGDSKKALGLKDQIIRLAQDKQKGISFEQYINWPQGIAYHQTSTVGSGGGIIREPAFGVDMKQAASKIIEPDWNSKSGGAGGVAYEAGKSIDVKQAAVRVLEPNWGNVESGRNGGKPKIWSSAEFEKMGKTKIWGAGEWEKLSGSQTAAAVAEKPAVTQVTENPVTPQETIVSSDVESFPELQRNWTEAFKPFMAKDAGNVISNLLRKISEDMSTNRTVNKQIEDVLGGSGGPASTEKLDKIIDIYAKSHELSPEERIFLGGEFVQDPEKFAVVQMEGGVKVIVAKGEGSHAIMIINDDDPLKPRDFQSAEFARFFIDQNGELATA